MNATLKSTGEIVYVLEDMGNLVSHGYLMVLFPFADGLSRRGLAGDVRKVRKEKLKIVKATIGLNG